MKHTKLALLALSAVVIIGCNKKKAEIDANTDAVKTEIEHRKDAVDSVAKEATAQTNANADIDKANIEANKAAAQANIEANKVAAQAQLDADKKKAEADAAVMSWRGTEGGVAAAKLKHNVVMSPGSQQQQEHRFSGNFSGDG